MDESSGRVIGFIASEKLDDEDYGSVFVPRVEEAIEEYGSVCILFQLDHFEGWTAAGAWEDFKMWPKMKHIERIAIVGDQPWEETMTRITGLIGAISGTEIRYFDEERVTEAWEWLRGTA